MPASLSPISVELCADFRSGKEPALEQLFRANFAALTAEAAERIGDVGTAQKVVAGAMVEVWDRHATVENPDQLGALLHKAIDGGVAHEIRRRAAHHHDGKAHEAPHLAPETADEWWTKVVGVLHEAKANPDEVARQRAERSRHEAAAHMKKVARPRRTGLYAVLVVVLAVLSAIPLWFFNQGAEVTKARQLLERDDAKVMPTRNGQRGTVTLADSVVVRLGASTTVKYPKYYPSDARALQVNGAAAFTAPATGGTVMVRVGKAWVFASGADFVVRSFPDDSGTAMVKALKGSVTVKFDKEEHALAAGAMTQVLPNGVFMDVPPDRAAMAFSWVDGTFDAQHLPLRRVLSEIKHWYGIDIIPKDSSFLDRPVAMTASLDSSKVALAALEEGGAVKVTLTTAERGTLVDNASAVKPKGKKK